MKLIYCEGYYYTMKQKNKWNKIKKELKELFYKNDNEYLGLDIYEKHVTFSFKDGNSYSFNYEYKEHLIELLKYLGI